MRSARGCARKRSRRPESARSGASLTVMASLSKKTLRAAEQDRPDIAAERAALKAQQPKLDAPRLVFIDETGVTTVHHKCTSRLHQLGAFPAESQNSPDRW